VPPEPIARRLCTRPHRVAGPQRKSNEVTGGGFLPGAGRSSWAPHDILIGPLYGVPTGPPSHLPRTAFLTVGTASSLSRGPKFEMLPRTHRTCSALGHRLVGIRSSLIAFCKRFSFGEVSSSRQSSSSQCLLVVYLSRPENVRPPDTSGSLLVAVYPAGRSTGTLKLPADLGLVVLCGPFQ
jgi:hypothetical protein